MSSIQAKTAKVHSFFVTTLPLFVLAHFGHHLMTALPGILLPFIRDDHSLSAGGFTNSQVALVSTTFSLAYGFGQLPGGWLADRIGRRAMIAIGIFGVALVGLIIGFSNTFTMLLILLVVMGLVGGGYHPAATPWISASAGEKNQGRAIGFHFIGGGTGYFVAPFIAGAIAAAWGWQRAFILLAIPCAVFGLVFFFILRRQKDNTKLRAVADSNEAGAVASRNHWKPLIALIILSFLTGSLGSVMIFFSLYLVDHFHVAKSTAVFVVALSSFAGIWAGPVGGWISDRIGRLPIIILTSLVGGLIIFTIRWVPYGAVLFAILLIQGVNMYLGAPVSEAFIMGHTSAKRRSFIYGLFYMVGQGSTLFAPVMGLLTEKIGYQDTFMYCGAGSILITLICGSILWSTRKLPSQVAEVSN